MRLFAVLLGGCLILIGGNLGDFTISMADTPGILLWMLGVALIILVGVTSQELDHRELQ